MAESSDLKLIRELCGPECAGWSDEALGGVVAREGAVEAVINLFLDHRLPTRPPPSAKPLKTEAQSQAEAEEDQARPARAFDLGLDPPALTPTPAKSQRPNSREVVCLDSDVDEEEELLKPSLRPEGKRKAPAPAPGPAPSAPEAPPFESLPKRRKTQEALEDSQATQAFDVDTGEAQAPARRRGRPPSAVRSIYDDDDYLPQPTAATVSTSNGAEGSWEGLEAAEDLDGAGGGAKPRARGRKASEPKLKAQHSHIPKKKRKNKPKSQTEALGEISVRVDGRLLQHGPGKVVVQELKEKGVEARSEELRIPHAILWLRHPDAAALDEDGPAVPEEGLVEPYLAVRLLPADLVALLGAKPPKNLDSLIDATRAQYPAAQTLFYIFEGLDTFYKTPEARAAHFDKAKMAHVIAALTLEKQCHVKLTASAKETGEFLVRMSGTIGFKPYKEKNPFVNFYADTTVKKTATTVTEVWVLQLQQVRSVSQPVAEAIAREYPTFRALMEQYLAPGLTNRQKEGLLENLVVGGGTSTRRVGPKLSAKLYKFFTADNKDSLVNE